MKKWFFRFLKAGFIALAVLVLGAMALFKWAAPNPRDIALVPMSVDAPSMQGVGFITNSTKAPWVVYIASSNKATAEVRVTRIFVTTDPLQAVSYNTPTLAPKDKVEFQIIYAKKLDPTNDSTNTKKISPPAPPPSLRPLPAQSRPSQPDLVPTAPGAATRVP